MKREFELVFGLLIGIGGTVGGWWILLTMFDLAPPIQYSILGTIVMFCTVVTFFSALIAAGPYFIYDSIRDFRKEEVGE